MTVTGRTRVVGLIGHPLYHSPLPELMNAAFGSLQEPYVMVPFDTPPASLLGALAASRTIGFAGLMIARPHKEAASAFMDRLGPTASEVRSVDTVSIEAGRLVGHNTDMWSFLAALKEGGSDVRGKRALLVGAGATARAVATAVLQEGAASLQIANRTTARGELLVAELAKKHPGARVGSVRFHPSDFKGALAEADLLVSAVPADLEGPLGPLVLEKDLHPALVVFDAAYASATPLLVAARHAGCGAIPGTRMLYWQVAFSVRQWTGRDVAVSSLERIDGREPAADGILS